MHSIVLQKQKTLPRNLKSVVCEGNSYEFPRKKLVASSAVETPVPIPNTVVKHCYVNDSWTKFGPAKVDRRQFFVGEFCIYFSQTNYLNSIYSQTTLHFLCRKCFGFLGVARPISSSLSKIYSCAIVVFNNPAN